MSLEGEVPDKAGVRVIRWGRAAVGSGHYSLTAVAAVHVAVGLHVVAVEHVGTLEKKRQKGGTEDKTFHQNLGSLAASNCGRESEQVVMGKTVGRGVDTYPYGAWRRVQRGVAAAAAPTEG